MISIRAACKRIISNWIAFLSILCLLSFILGFNCTSRGYFHSFNDLDQFKIVEVPIPAGFTMVVPVEGLPKGLGVSFVSDVKAWNLLHKSEKTPDEDLIIIHVMPEAIIEGRGQKETIKLMLTDENPQFICNIPDASMARTFPLKNVNMIEFYGQTRVKEMDVGIRARWFLKNKSKFTVENSDEKLCAWTKAFLEANKAVD